MKFQQPLLPHNPTKRQRTLLQKSVGQLSNQLTNWSDADANGEAKQHDEGSDGQQPEDDESCLKAAEKEKEKEEK